MRARLRRGDWHIVIQCFFDDSGSEAQHDHKHVVLAGYLGHDSIWQDFNWRWEHLLLRHGLPEVHMKNWEKIRLARSWTVSHGNDVLGEFIECIRRSLLIGFGVAVDADAYRALPQARRERFGNAQEFCFTRIMRKIIDRVELAKQEDVLDIVFDQDFEFSRARLKLVDHLFKFDKVLSKRVGSLCFANARYHYGLQAADFLAWTTRRRLADQALGKPITYTWGRLFTEMPSGLLEYTGEHWDQDLLDRKLPEAEAEYEKQIMIEQAQAALEKARAS